MPLNRADIAVFSRLLDEALALPEAQREHWLDALPAEHRAHRETLRDLLAHAGRLDGDPLFDALPELDDEEVSIAQRDKRVGPYRLLRQIGQGGMGSVWLAERADGAFKRQVALKLPRLNWGAGLAQRMALERDIGALLEHPHIARLYDAGVDDLGRPYLALEYVDGQPIDTWCDARRLNVAQRLRVFVQVIQAVSYAHGRLVVHRDLKPSNVLVTADGQVRLLDFGIAKLLDEAGSRQSGLTREQGRVLTPEYASPEQLTGDPVTVQSDVYSLGVLLYELLTGERPIVPKRSTPGAVEEAILAGDAAPASSRVKDAATARALRREVDAVIAKAMQREPAKRYATADALAHDIERHLRGETVTARRENWTYRWIKAIRRNRLAFSAGTAVAIAVLGGAGISVVQARRANESAQRARVVKEFVVDVFKANSRDSTANRQLRQLPAELLLEHGAKLIETKFADQPGLRMELFGVVGGIFADIGAYRLAADYIGRQVDMLGESHAPPRERAQATLLLAETLFNDLQLPEANAQTRRALALSETDADLHARATVLLVRVLRRQGRNDEAWPLLEAAERQLKGESAPSAVGAQTKAIRAAYLSNRNAFDKALPMYDAAIDEALAAEGPRSPAAVDIRLIVAHELAAHSRGADAVRYQEAALKALRETGGTSDMRAALEESEQTGRMFQMGQLPAGPAAAAIRQAQAQLAVHGTLVPARIKASVDFDLAKVLVLSGDLHAAGPLLDSSIALLRAQSPGPRERFQYAGFQALMALYAGRHEQADAFFDEIIATRRELGTAKHPFAVHDHASKALNLLMAGRFEAAQTALAGAPSLGDAAVDKAQQTASYAGLVPRVQARLSLARGDAAAALRLLPPAPSDEWPPQFPYDDGLLRGEILCALDQRDAGLGLLEKSLAWHEAQVHPHHPELARARAVTAACAWATGRRARAIELAGLAEAALAAQPDVSPYFSRPVRRLASALGASAQRPR